METKGSPREVTNYGLDLDGLLSWEEFYGSNNEDLVGSILEMYDLLIGRSSEIKEDLVKSQSQIDPEKTQASIEETIKVINVKKGANLELEKNHTDYWCDFIKQDWNCCCIDNSSIEPVTRCVACNLKESKNRHVSVGESQISKNKVLNTASNCQSEPSLSLLQNRSLSKCELVTCPAGFSTPSTPVQQRFKRFVNQLPLSLKRSESYFRWVARPSSVNSLVSSSSSSSGSSSGYAGRSPNKSSPHLASIESLEDDSYIEREDQKDKLSRFSKETGSKDSGVHSLCASLPQDKPKYYDPHLSYMDKVVTEIIETEEIYVGDLRSIIEGYLIKWRSLPNFPLKDQLDIIFGNIETVFNFNSLFLEELKQCGLDPVKVAKCFVKNNSGFSVYTEYCTNYPKTVSWLTELMRQEGTVRLFRERQADLQHTLPLGSYLLKPVQRILKYHLLLENIVKQYSNGIEGYRDIVDALRTMTEIAQHINDMKRRHEHEVRVQEIQSLLLGWEEEDLTTFGELCAEGTFRIYGAKALRHVFLFDKMLLITKKKEGNFLDYKTHIYCSNLMLIESVPGEPLSFHVIPFDNPRLQYTLQCRNLEQKREWTWQIKRVILENYNAVIPSHARELVMELGQNKSDDDTQINKILPKRHHLAPEYLEKRKQERGKTDSNLKCRVLMNKKLETGYKLEDQFHKQTVTAEQTPLDTFLNGTKKETEHVQLLNNGKTNLNSEKLEIKTLEQIVTQILKQNREFDKILKRQKHIISGIHDLKSQRIAKKETQSKPRKIVQETLQSFKLLRNLQPETSAAKTKESDHRLVSDYFKLINDGSKSDGKPKSKEFPGLLSFTQTEKVKDNFFSGFAEKNFSEESIPTSPSVWLRKQMQHLPVAPQKAGSLPRSFQITSESSHNETHYLRDFRVSLERPFTIASDKITSTMLVEDIEKFYRGQFCPSNINITMDGSLTDDLRTPGESLDHLNIHPDYKIYRSGASTNIIKNLLSSMHSKLSHIKAEVVQKHEPEKKMFSRERRASRVIYMLAKHYHKTLRIKQRVKDCENILDLSNNTTLVNLPVYKQGSKNLGARLANFKEPGSQINWIRCSKKAAAFLGIYTDSVLSIHSIPQSTASKYSNIISKPKNPEIIPKYQKKNINNFYEKQFEHIDEGLSQLGLHARKSQEGNEFVNQIFPKFTKELINKKMSKTLRHEIALNSKTKEKQESLDFSIPSDFDLDPLKQNQCLDDDKSSFEG